ncbi:DUF4843 domain-containing protein [Sphingobacterium sp. LRF_L2]|uniref:DUF4843 domain-containing protein n=1 Tax=Sphingobacterium sp. LRF_L2 TaxID=3369421 RepID=UPI003F633D5D
MKLFNYLILSCVLICTSCEKNKDLLFSPEKKDLNIWLGQSGAPLDSITYNFSYNVDGHDSILFNYRILGLPLEEDAEFELEALDGDIDLVYFSFGKYIIKAGQTEGKFPIYFDQPANYNEFKLETGKIRFQLKENDAFKRGVNELSKLKVVLKNGLSKPDNWDVAPLYYLKLNTYFGSYSEKKHSLIIQETGQQTINVYQVLNAITREDANAISAGKAIFYRDQCKSWLAQYKESNNGQALLDENNQEVVFP